MDDRISRVAVFGSGQMGPGIAGITALAGCSTTLVARSSVSLERGRKTCNAALDFLLANEVISPDERSAAAARLTFTTDDAAAVPADLVIEAIAEDVAVKQEFFAGLEKLFPTDTILASCTSALRITDIAANLKHPERAVTAHFWNPPHLMPLVDLMKGDKTSEETVQRMYAFLKRCGKQPVIGRKDVPGPIGNRLQHALIREAVYMVQEGMASVEDVETAIKAGFGLRLPVYGPFEHMDASSVALTCAVQSTVSPSLCDAKDALPILKKMVAEGNIGARTGKGWYDWSTRSVDELRQRRDQFLVERMKEARGGRRIR